MSDMTMILITATCVITILLLTFAMIKWLADWFNP